jgi:hypothetical protein
MVVRTQTTSATTPSRNSINSCHDGKPVVVPAEACVGVGIGVGVAGVVMMTPPAVVDDGSGAV